jgi:hypothetical protein
VDHVVSGQLVEGRPALVCDCGWTAIVNNVDEAVTVGESHLHPVEAPTSPPTDEIKWTTVSTAPCEACGVPYDRKVPDRLVTYAQFCPRCGHLEG